MINFPNFAFILLILSCISFYSCERCNSDPDDITSLGSTIQLLDLQYSTPLIGKWGRHYDSDSVYIYASGNAVPIQIGVSGEGSIGFNPIYDNFKTDSLFTRTWYVHLPDPITGKAHDDIDTVTIFYKLKMDESCEPFKFSQYNFIYNDSTYLNGTYRSAKLNIGKKVF